MLFSMLAHTNGRECSVLAEVRGRTIYVSSEFGPPTTARSLRDALTIASRVVGPTLEKAGRTSCNWGLLVRSSGATAQFGESSPTAEIQIAGPPPRPGAPVARIFSEWRRHDGTPVGALNAACKIVEAYARDDNALAA